MPPYYFKYEKLLFFRGELINECKTLNFKAMIKLIHSSSFRLMLSSSAEIIYFYENGTLFFHKNKNAFFELKESQMLIN